MAAEAEAAEADYTVDILTNICNLRYIGMYVGLYCNSLFIIYYIVSYTVANYQDSN